VSKKFKSFTLNDTEAPKLQMLLGQGALERNPRICTVLFCTIWFSSRVEISLCLMHVDRNNNNRVKSAEFVRDFPGKAGRPISFPYHSHTSRDSYGSSMGMGVPLLGLPGISLEFVKSTTQF